MYLFRGVVKTKFQFLSVISFGFLAVLALVAPRQAYAQPNYSFQNWCQVGGQQVMLAGLPSTTTVQQSFPNCTVSVYFSGTLTLSPIFSDKIGTIKGNPFTANSDASFLFYASPSVPLDIVISGGGMPSPRTFVGVVVNSTGSTGALFPSTPAIVVNISTLAARNALFGDVVGLWGGSGCIGFLKNDGTCSTAGGGTPGGSPLNAQFNNAGVFGGSRATFDASGNFKSLSDDGTLKAYLFQTTPTSNNGIQNALQTANAIVVAGNDYPCVEGTFSSPSPNYRLGIGVPAPFANATTLIDDRSLCGARGYYVYNPALGVTGNVSQFNRFVENHLPATGGGITEFLVRNAVEYSGSGINDGFTQGGPDSEGFSFETAEIMTRGIQSYHNIEEQVLSGGDNHLYQNQITNNRGSWDVNGEGFNWLRNEIQQNLTPLVMTANACSGAHTCDPITPANYAAGATLIQGTLIGNNPFPGDGTYLTDTTKGGPVVQVLQDTPPGVAGICAQAGQWQVNATLTPDNIGCVASPAVSVPNLRYGGTTNVSVGPVTGLTSALTTSQTVCVSDHLFTESAKVINAGSFSGGTATGAVLALRYAHTAPFYVTQGSHACNAMEVKANQQPGTFVGRQLFRIIGVEAGSPNHYLYARTVFGGWNQGFSNYAKTYDVANAGTTLTRNGSNVVSAPVSDGSLLLFNATIRISACADSSFNGVSVITADTGSSVTWNNPVSGAATTTTCTKDIELVSKLNNTQGIRDVQEFPAAEIVNTNDPVTFAINDNLSVETNTNLAIAAADQLENNPYADVIMGFDRNLMNFQSQTASSIAQLMHFDQISGAIPSSTTWWRIAFADSTAGYQGLGGSKGIGLSLMDFSNTTAPFSEIFFNMPVPTGNVFQFNGCVYGCSDSRSQTTFWSFEMNNGFYSQNINQATYAVHTNREDVATNQIFNTFESNQGFSHFTANGLSGASEEENLFEWSPGSTRITTSSNNGSTTNIFFMSPTATTFSRPITITGTANGCATFAAGVLGSTGTPCPTNTLTGSITTTGATTDVVTITGMTSSGHCGMSPTNATAGTMIQNATPVYIDTFTTNAITIHHVATGGALFSFVCTAN